MVNNKSRVNGGNAKDNSIPNATFNREQIKAFIEESAENAIDFAIQRNPTIIYKFIRQNYGTEYANLKSGAEVSWAQMEGMSRFLIRKYSNLPENQRRHFLATIYHSLPRVAQLQNWTTPTNQ